MKAVIMAGGEGRRLRPYTYILPKPLLPIGERPILELILENLKKYGILDVILLTNYKADFFEMMFGNGSKMGLNIEYSRESEPLGTAGPLKLVREKLKEDFLVMNGDILTDLDFSKLIEFHKKNNSDVTIVTKRENIILDYGMIKVEKEKVVGWEEKPALSTEISTGIYMLSPSVLKYLPENGKCDMDEFVRKIIAANGKVSGFLYEGKWLDVGRIEDHQRAEAEIRKQFE